MFYQRVCGVIGLISVLGVAAEKPKDMSFLLSDWVNTDKFGHMISIPEHFNVSDGNLLTRHIQDIEKIANRINASVHYSVSIGLTEAVKPWTRKHRKGGIKTKKFNVPLKKNALKVSSFERMLRRIAEEKNVVRTDMYTSSPSETYTNYELHKYSHFSTKPPHSGKYKPIIRKKKMNYKKHVKPVKSSVTTLVT